MANSDIFSRKEGSAMEPRKREIAEEVIAANPEEGKRFMATTAMNALFNNPRTRTTYAEICALAADMATSPERRVRFLLQQVYGLRNMASLWNVSAINALMDQIMDEIRNLEDDDLRKGAEESWNYHAALVYRETGQFHKAIELHVANAKQQQGFARTESMFIAAVERFHRDLAAGGGPLLTSLAELDFIGKQMEQYQAETPVALQRCTADLPTHRLYGRWLAGLINEDLWEYEEREQDFSSLASLKPELATSYQHWVWIAEAFHSRAEGKPHPLTRNAVNRVLERSAYSASNMIALMIIGVMEQNNNRPGIAREQFRWVVSYPMQGGEFIRPIAQRLLDAIVT